MDDGEKAIGERWGVGDYIYHILLLIAAAVVVVDVEEAVAVKAMGNSAMVMAAVPEVERTESKSGVCDGPESDFHKHITTAVPFLVYTLS